MTRDYDNDNIIDIKGSMAELYVDGYAVDCLRKMFPKALDVSAAVAMLVAEVCRIMKSGRKPVIVGLDIEQQVKLLEMFPQCRGDVECALKKYIEHSLKI